MLSSIWNFFFQSYLPSNAEEKLRKYVYRGTDKSFFYNYVMSPLCARLVKYLPVWLSANVISIMAFSFVFATHMLIAFYMPALTVEDDINLNTSVNLNNTDEEVNKNVLLSPPTFIFILSALALISYFILDNLDGRQARRTKTASPLGLIIDHGCDALNCVVVALSVSSCLSLGPTWKSWLFLIFMVAVFFMNTWEEYYIGELILPVVNGANEGILLVLFLYFFTAWVKSPQWWCSNGLRISHSLLPAVLAQPAQFAAVTVEKNVLQFICPYITTDSFFLFNVINNNSDSSNNNNNNNRNFFFGFNCSDEYITSPPLPIITINDKKQTSLFIGHSAIQNFILKLYDPCKPETILIRYNTLIVMIFVLSSIITIMGNLKTVYNAVSRKNIKGRRQVRTIAGKIQFVRVLLKLLPLVIIFLFGTFWLLTSPTNIFKKHPRIFCWVFGIIFTNSSITLMLAHVCDMKFSLFNRLFWIFFFYAVYMCVMYYHEFIKLTMQHYNVHNYYYNYYLPSFVTSNNFWSVFLSNEENMLYFFFVLCVFAHLHLSFNVVLETASVLKVPLFFVPQTNQEALKRLQIESKTNKVKKNLKTQ